MSGDIGKVNDQDVGELSPSRVNLIAAVEFLANSPNEPKHICYDESGTLVSFHDFDLAINVLFDNIRDLNSNPRGQIGENLANEEEADAALTLVQALDVVLDVDHPDDIDAEYVKTPRWLKVVAAAQHMMLAIAASGKS